MYIVDSSQVENVPVTPQSVHHSNIVRQPELDSGELQSSNIAQTIKLKRKPKEPDTYDGKSTDFKDYMVHFEQVATSEMAQQLCISLRENT